MPETKEKKSLVDILNILAERVRRIEYDAERAAAFIDAMVARIESNKAAAKAQEQP